MRNTTNISHFLLCEQCSQFLVIESNSVKANKNKNTWPSFVWEVLKNSKIHDIYGIAMEILVD